MESSARVNGLEMVDLIFFHRKKASLGRNIVIPFYPYTKVGATFIYWILSSLTLFKRNANWSVKVKYQDQYIFTDFQWKQMFPFVEEPIAFKDKLSHLSLEEIYGQKCLMFCDEIGCSARWCELLHDPIISLLQICGHIPAWFPSSFNKDIFISSVRKGVNTFIFLIDIKQEHIYYSQFKFGMWSQPEKLGNNYNMMVEYCVKELKKDKGTQSFSPLENLLVFNWCFPVFPTLRDSAMFNLMQGKVLSSCRVVHEPEAHPHNSIVLEP